MSLTAPKGKDDVAATYVADPADPVPYRHRPIQSTYGQGSQWRTWLVEDQQFVSGRKDLANFETPALNSDVTVTGDVVADLFAATTGSDTDWVVKLIDVYPRRLPVDGCRRNSARALPQQLHEPRAGEAGRGEGVQVEPARRDHTFLKGHRMMVEVQSSWFPLYDRNPQTWVPNIMTAPASAYKAETLTIYASPKYPSHLELPLADGSDLP